MNRHAPELALVAGFLLGGTALAFGLLVAGDVHRSTLSGIALCYPFAAYAVYRSDDPTRVLPPRAVLAAAALAAAAVWIDAVRVGSGAGAAVYGGFLALLVALPAAAYATRYGSPPAALRPRPVAVATTLIAVAFVAVGAMAGASIYGAAAGLLAFLSGALFARSRGYRPSDRARRLAPVGGLALGGGCVAAGALVGGSLDAWVVSGVAAAFGPILYAALTADRR